MFRNSYTNQHKSRQHCEEKKLAQCEELEPDGADFDFEK